MRKHQLGGRQDGFSMIELLIVGAIIAIMSAVALPSIIDGVRWARVRGAARALATELQRARSTAVMKNVNHGVILVFLDTTTYRFVIEDGQIDRPNPGANKGSCLAVSEALTPPAVESQAGHLMTLPPDVLFRGDVCATAGESSGIRFNRLGMASRPVAAAGCPAIDTGQAVVTFSAAGGSPVDGTATICIEDSINGRAQRITVTPGGRVFLEDVAPVAP